jgi:hypothetical protein
MPRRASSILEVVVAEAAYRAGRHRRRAGSFPRCRRPAQQRLGFTVAPRLVRDAAERKPRLLDRAAFDIEADRDRDQGERVGQAIADLQVGVVAGKALRRQLDRGDDLVRPQIAVDLRRIARQAVEIGKRDVARSPPLPVASTRASRAASATHMSEGWVAM